MAWRCVLACLLCPSVCPVQSGKLYAVRYIVWCAVGTFCSTLRITVCYAWRCCVVYCVVRCALCGGVLCAVVWRVTCGCGCRLTWRRCMYVRVTHHSSSWSRRWPQPCQVGLLQPQTLTPTGAWAWTLTPRRCVELSRAWCGPAASGGWVSGVHPIHTFICAASSTPHHPAS